MRIALVAPVVGEVRTGDQNAIRNLSERFTEMGHRITDDGADLLVALNAHKSHEAITAFRRAQPDARIVVVLTGTDVYPELGDAARESLRLADRIVGLQPGVRERIPAEWRDRLRIIVQSAVAAPGAQRRRDFFDICVVGHMREVKDPLRAAAASRLLPAESKIRIRHAGAILEASYRERVDAERAENPRYTWLGHLEPADALRLIGSSRLQVVSSVDEGGGRVIGESVVAGTPLFAARSDATVSLLGDRYPGLYDVGETQQLADLMTRAETDDAFFDELVAATTKKAAQFDPRREHEAWRALIEELAG